VTYEAILELLRWAGDHERPVRVALADGRELVAVPTALDTHLTVHETWLLPVGADDEISVSLGEIARVELA
jgi:hypothetical protein